MPRQDVIVRPNQTAVYVVHPVLKQAAHQLPLRSAESFLEEACGLAEAIDLNILAKEIINLSKISPSTYLGQGVIERLKQEIGNKKIKLLFVDTSLTPGQQRNLENECKCKVIDRTGMILEIFGERAKTHEGVLQVELAALSYQRSRLVRSWTHLERQRGGHGFLGGPGEKQLELDRRMLEQRIIKIKEELKNVVRTRRLQRKEREKNRTPVIALVGYTNAGKSTLFNRLKAYDVIPDDADKIEHSILKICREQKPDLLIASGGTGPGPRDVTPDVLAKISDRMLDGLGDVLRTESLYFTDTAWLSRMTACMVGATLVIAFPGSPKAVKECWDNRCECAGKRHAFCNLGSNFAPSKTAIRTNSGIFRYRRVYLKLADTTCGRISCNVGRGTGSRFDTPCARHFRHRNRSTETRC